MTREALESGRVRHPLDLAGLGRGPFALWKAIRLPRGEGRAKALEGAATLFRVEARRCGCCRLPSDDLYVVTGADGRNSAVCLPCLAESGDGGLLRRARYLDHEHHRLTRAVTSDWRRKDWRKRGR